MNNFNPDKKLHNIEVINPALEVEDDTELKGGEVSPDLNLEALPELHDTAEEAVIERVGESTEEVEGGVEDIELPDLDAIEDEYPFDRDSETGLSLQLTNIENLKAQLQALEEDGAGYEEIKLGIEADRSQKKIEFETSLEEEKRKLRDIYTQLYTKGKGAGSFTGNAEQMVIINSYLGTLKSNSKYSAQAIQIEGTINTIKSKIEQLTTQLSDFNTETQSQIAEAIKVTKDTLQTELSQAQQEYTGTEAEAFDTKILLERQLEGQLTDPNNLFSQDNINQIFATYGLKEGRDRLQQLREESTQAREQVARNEIREDIFSYVFDYRNNPDLAQALSIDIQTKLESLQQVNPESDTVRTALSLEGPAKLDYLTSSQDPKLNALAFWYNKEANIDQVLSEHPQFAQYVKSKTDEGYRQQQQKITEGRLGGRIYLNSESDKQLQQEIDSRIEDRTNRYKSESISNIRSEISGIVDNEPFFTQDKQDQLMVAGRDQFGAIGLVTEANSFKTELSQSGNGIVLSAEGSFEIAGESPISQNSELAQQKNTIEIQIKQSLAAEGYNINTIEGIDNILGTIQADIDKENNKILFKDKNKVTSLTVLKANIESQRQEYNQLQEQIDTNIRKFDEIRVNITELNSLYKKLPQYIQNKLRVLQDKSISNIAVTIDAAVQELQSYETPAELKAQKERIAQLQQQIVELEAIK